jgi:endothelin-converting enzyme/putative endopeptidase
MFALCFSTGQQQNSPLWKRCVQQTDVSLGELLGRYFVSYAFSPAAKGLAEDMMTRIENAFRKNLPGELSSLLLFVLYWTLISNGLLGVDWMDDITRKLAEEKLSMVAKLIGTLDQALCPLVWKVRA